MYTLYINEKKIVLSLLEIDTINLYIWTILTLSLKKYVIRFHDLISMNIFFTKRSE